MSNIELLTTANNHWMVRSHNVVFDYWTSAPTAGQFPHLQRMTLDLQDRLDQDLLLFNVVVAGADEPRFSAEVRREMREAFADDRSYRLGVVQVFELSGLVSVAVRAIINTAWILGRSQNPTRAFGSVNEALPTTLRWLGAGTRSWTDTELRAAERDARARRPVAAPAGAA